MTENEASTFEADFVLEQPAPGVFEREVDQKWWGWNGQFGGYTLGLALQACRDHVSNPAFRERVLTLHFLRRIPEGRVTIQVTTERQGRTVENLSLRMMVDDKLVITGLALFARDRDAEVLPPLELPDLVLPAATEESQPNEIPVPAAANFDVWPRSPGALRSGTKSSTSGGWMRLKEPGGADERFGCMAADGYPPVAVMRASESAAGGTMDFTAHFQRPFPASVVSGHEPVRVILTTKQSIHGYTDEDADIWTADGQLLMRTHQVRYSERVDLAAFGDGLDPPPVVGN